MLRVGLTGGIGAGKSTVANRLAERGAVVVDADRLARAVVEPGTEGLAEIVASFGREVLADDGSLDRPALGRMVFTDVAARERLNAITHPRIAALTLQAFAAAPPDAVVVHDVPLLVENRMGARYHLVVVVHAPQDERVRRLVAERGMVPEDAWARVRAQADDDARRLAADVWLDNTGARAEVLDAVDRLWDQRIRPFEANVRARRCAVRVDPGAPDLPVVPDGNAVSRLVARVLLATGLPAGSVEPVGGELQVRVAGPDAADALQDALADAGFPRLTASDGGVLHASADPAAPAVLHLVWA